MQNNPFIMDLEPSQKAVCPHCQSTKFIIQESTIYNGFQDPETPEQISVSKIKVNEIDWIVCEECNTDITEELAHLEINFP